MKLAEVLRIHDEARSEQGLPLSLGDSYLLRHNFVYRAVREQILAAGFACTTEDFCHYAVLPYAALGSILKEKKIPYFDNVTVLREIEAKHPGRFQIEELVQVKPNYVLHESAHCLADLALKDSDSQVPALSPEQRTALPLLMAESFANSVEALANTGNTTPELRFFHASNSYIVHDKKAATAFRQAIELLGARLAYRLLFASYLLSNCLVPELALKQYQQLVDTSIADAEIRRKAMDSPHVRKMAQYAFELSMDFRLRTTGFYLAHAGLRGDLRQLLRIDVLGLLKNTDLIEKFLRKTETVFR